MDVEAHAASTSQPACDDTDTVPFGTRVTRWRAPLICTVAVAAALCGALSVAGLADLAASPKGKELGESVRRSMPRWLQTQRWYASSPARGLQTQCPYDNIWVGTQWNRLSAQEKMAWTMLGWVKDVWDQSWGMAQKGVTTTTSTLPATTTLFGATTVTFTTTSFLPMTEQTCWQDLKEDEKDAATLLGYSIQRWRDCKQQGCSWPPGVPPMSATCLTKMKYLKSKLNTTMNWLNITQMRRHRLVYLGWDPDGNAWKAGRYPFTYGRPWSELTVREREAATFLGYTNEIWESCEAAADSPCLARLEDIETQQRSWIWERLDIGTRENMGDLGWQSRTWYEGETPAVMKAPWLGLTDMQKTAARILGYTGDTWRSCPDATCLDRFAYVQKRWCCIGWMQMKLSERRAWMLLGHSEALWSAGVLPATMLKRWEELTPEQRVEATFLGHSEGTWQGCNTEWTGRNETVTNETQLDPSDAVRARMVIDRPYSEISGNVYGTEVGNMPTSFIRVFESAIARAVFCGNPPLSLDPNTYIGEDGEPLCVQRTRFETQKYRVRVLNVVEGSIVVDFFFVANATPSQPTSRMLFEALSRQIDAKLTSPICHDKYFGRYAKAATMVETRLSSLRWIQMQEALNFEPKRRFYTASNMCLLKTDAKLGVTSCGASSAMGLPRAFLSRDFAGLFLALAALAFTFFA